jgi:arylsulfatase A-like enzyme
MEVRIMAVRRVFISFGWLAACGAALFAAVHPVLAADARQASPDKRPNILFIYTDDQSWNTLGCYNGWPWVHTPNIDRLAKEGVRFTQAYGEAWCAPSRACVMTGLYLHAIRGLHFKNVMGGGNYDSKICRFWPAELRKAGYRTTMIGKWHLGPDSGYGRDWDHAIVWNQADIKGDWYNDQILSIDGAPKGVVPGYSTDVYTRFAVEEIKRPHDKPWFMWLCYNAPHLPNTYAPRHKDRYKGAEVPIPFDIFGPRPGKPEYMQAFTMWKLDKSNPAALPMRDRQTLPEYVRSYNRLVCALDEGVGQILAALADTGQLDNTLIVYTTDQGFAIGERGFCWKVGPYEACMRMPLIVRLPGRVAQGEVCHQPVGLIDLPPTFFAMLGLPQPWPLHGHDLQPLLKDPQARWDYPLLLEHFRWEFGPETDRGLTGDAALGGVPWWLTLWKGQYKYIRTLVPNEIEELYDFTRDPDERHNLALDADHASLLADYRDQMMAELVRTNAGLLKNLPAPKTP